MRRIKSVSLTIPGVLGPFVGVHCRLTLLSSATRVDPRLSGPVATCCERPMLVPGTRACGCCGQVTARVGHPATNHDGARSGYAALPDDPRIVKQYGAMEAIATSSGQNDSGLFELNFRDERYLPFEFSGAVSRWRIELPAENNYFDVSTVSDVVMHLGYTAREGGDVLRAAAAEEARAHLPDGGRRVIDVRNELPDVWHAFSAMPPSTTRAMELELTRDLFPFLPGQPELRVTGLEMLLETSRNAKRAADTRPAHVTLELGLPDAHDCDHDDDCPGATRLVTCAASAEWPCLYHGATSVTLGPIAIHRDGSHRITLTVPAGVGRIERLFLVCNYEARGHLRSCQ
jgi:hypothetical protein